MIFKLIDRTYIPPILVEEGSYPGIRKIAGKVAEDIEKVSNKKPLIVTSKEEAQKEGETMILFATLGKSPLLKWLQKENKVKLREIEAKREVFGIFFVDQPWEGTKQLLLICGSDKRGTIYGMFQMSEHIGISPMHYLCDATPEKKETLILEDTFQMVSKEPSVRLRGFFINDEWPCFGNWTFSHFGGFTADMYDHVFELLLRLKGNYLWPAMWTSSFALDGPGLANAELAHEYGIVIGNSHHEPCLRASEEWDINRGPDSSYGNEWNYYTNKEGLLAYWEDGLKRSGKYEGVITVGMRGERDSSMLGPEASLQQNIDLLKEIITNQKRLIQTYVHEDLEKVPMLLALYKEVEPYFYGDENTKGLKDWDGLDGITLLFCEDNHGNMRTLPTKDMLGHPGGFGMYYHFDYHGDPISYEWVNSTPLTKVWEQMTMAYEFGVRDVWIVNVGDLKWNEFPLGYFMALAYDFDTWGTKAPNRTGVYTKQFMKQLFGSRISEKQLGQLVKVQTAYVDMNGQRRPEALNDQVYHPVHYYEADRMIIKALEVMGEAEQLWNQLPFDCANSFYSTIYFPAVASMNLLLMHLYAGKNRHYALLGKPIANEYSALVTACIEKDKALAKEFGEFLDGKWNGMQLAQHIGFTKWNEDNCRYPIRMQIEPAYKPRMVVSRGDDDILAVKDYFAPMVIVVDDFLYPGKERVDILVANDGIGSFVYKIKKEQCPWLTVEQTTDQVVCQEVLTLVCHRENLPSEKEQQIVTLTDGDTTVKLHVFGKQVVETGLPPMTFLEDHGVITMNANHFKSLDTGKETALLLLEEFGKCGFGLKAFPCTTYSEEGSEPGAVFSCLTTQEGAYVMELWSAPSNPMRAGGRMRYTIAVDGVFHGSFDTIPEGFLAGVPHNPGWTQGVLDNIRITKVKLNIRSGVHNIRVGFLDAGLVLERICLYRKENEPKPSYFGPEESCYVKEQKGINR